MLNFELQILVLVSVDVHVMTVPSGNTVYFVFLLPQGLLLELGANTRYPLLPATIFVFHSIVFQFDRTREIDRGGIQRDTCSPTSLFMQVGSGGSNPHPCAVTTHDEVRSYYPGAQMPSSVDESV